MVRFVSFEMGYEFFLETISYSPRAVLINPTGLYACKGSPDSVLNPSKLAWLHGCVYIGITPSETLLEVLI